VGNHFTSCCELHRLAEDDEIHNVNHEQVEEEQLEREQNERDALDAVGDYECPPECLSRLVWCGCVVVNIKTLKKRLIDCTQVRDRSRRGEESRNEEESCRSVCSQV